MKILLDYDPESQWIIDPTTQVQISLWAGLEQHEYKPEVITEEIEVEKVVRDCTDKVAQLKASGFSTEDIIKMKEAGLL